MYTSLYDLYCYQYGRQCHFKCQLNCNYNNQQVFVHVMRVTIQVFIFYVLCKSWIVPLGDPLWFRPGFGLRKT